MATKKKELLEQETPVSETTALEDSPVPSEDTTMLHSWGLTQMIHYSVSDM